MVDAVSPSMSGASYEAVRAPTVFARSGFFARTGLASRGACFIVSDSAGQKPAHV
jgi:hypothetical protein